MFAALYGNAEAVRRLLAAGADPNFANERGTTPLMWAVADEGVVRQLLDAGARPDATNAQNASPVSIAAMRFGAAPMVELLLERGAAAATARVNTRQSNRPSGALPMAAAAGDEQVFRLLVESGVDPRATTWQALHQRRPDELPVVRRVHSRLVRAEQYVSREAVTPLDGRDTNAAPRSVRSPGDLNPIDRRRLPRRPDLSRNQ